MVWHRAKDLAVYVYKITGQGAFAKDFGLRDQIRRSSVSIPSNIAEGKERETVKELVRYLYISKGSAAELKTQLLIAHKVGYVNAQTYTYFSERILKVSKMLGSFIGKLKSKSE